MADKKKTYHNSQGEFCSKGEATSVSFGHYSRPNGGKFQYKNGPKIAKHHGGSKYTKKGSGGRGQNKYRLKDKTAKWEEELIKEMGTDRTADRLGTELKASNTRIQRLKLALAKEEHRNNWLHAEISTLNEEDQVEDNSTEAWRKTLKIAGLSIDEINKVLDTE